MRRYVVTSGIAVVVFGVLALPQMQSQVRNSSSPVAPAPVPSQITGDDVVTQKGGDLDNLRSALRAAHDAERQTLSGAGEFSRLQCLTALAQSQSDIEQSSRELEEQANDLAAQEPNIMVLTDSSGWLGVDIGEVTAEKARSLKLSSPRGALVNDVEPDSPASKAGLQAGDVILEFEHQPVEGTVQFRRLVRETPPGRTIPLTVWRDGRLQALSIEVGDRGRALESNLRAFGPRDFAMPNFDSHDFQFDMPEMFSGITPALGISAEDLSGQLGAYFGAPDGEGVLVREVRAGSPAEKAGLQTGDVITRLDNAPVRSVAGLREQLHARREQKSVTLATLRKGAPLTVTVTLDHPRHAEPTHLSQSMAL
jgi:serine protease Do